MARLTKNLSEEANRKFGLWEIELSHD